ncbi:MAG TPA: universal stress protein [Armatimonadaceae bacterium]|nr:universal stress protein [Armatimonadaceae bacterium]
MFKKVLVPTDGSPASLRAAEAVAALVAPAKDSVDVTLILAIAPIKPEETDLDADIVTRQNANMRQAAQRALDKTSAVFDEYGIKHDTRVIEGDPVSAAIASEAETGGYDVIAMGSRGMGMQKGDVHYIGSVTERVIRRVGVPVLVLPIK